MTQEELDKLREDLEDEKAEIESNVKKFKIGFLIAIIAAGILVLLLLFGCTTKDNYKFTVVKAKKVDQYQVVTFSNSFAYHTLILPPWPEYKEGDTLNVK